MYPVLATLQREANDMSMGVDPLPGKPVTYHTFEKRCRQEA